MGERKQRLKSDPTTEIFDSFVEAGISNPPFLPQTPGATLTAAGGHRRPCPGSHCQACLLTPTRGSSPPTGWAPSSICKTKLKDCPFESYPKEPPSHPRLSPTFNRRQSRTKEQGVTLAWDPPRVQPAPDTGGQQQRQQLSQCSPGPRTGAAWMQPILAKATIQAPRVTP